MATLDTFYLLFKSQGADQVKRDQDNLDRSSQKLNQNLKKTDTQTTNLSDSFFALGKRLGFALAGLGLAAKTVSAFKNAVSYGADVEKASRALNVNVSDLDAWGTAVSKIGGSSEGFQSSLKNLSERLYTSGQNALKVLPQLADGLQKMSRVGAIRYGKTLGLDEYTILLLRQGGDAVQKLIEHQKELGVVTTEQATAIREYNMQWADTKQAFRAFGLEAAQDLLPILTKFLNILTDLMVGFRKLVQWVSEFSRKSGEGAAMFFSQWKSAASGIKNVFSELIDYIMSLFKGLTAFFDKFFSAIGKRVEGLTGTFGKVKGFFSKDKKIDEVASAQKSPEIQKQVANVQKALTLASASPLLSTTSNAISNSFLNNEGSADKAYNITMGDITIETQSDDPDGIVDAFTKGLEAHFRQTVNTFDDGVRI